MRLFGLAAIGFCGSDRCHQVARKPRTMGIRACRQVFNSRTREGATDTDIPYKIYCQKGDWYVIGFCHKHTAFRTYNLSRMKNIVQTADFVPEPAYKEKIRIDPNYGIWNNDSPPKKIVLVFEKSVNTYILERTWHKNQLCSQNADGSVCLSFESNQMQEVLHWILSFGSAVTVQNPPELKSLYCEEVKKMMEKLK